MVSLGVTSASARSSVASLSRVRPPALIFALGAAVALMAGSQAVFDPEPLPVQVIEVGVPLVLSGAIFYVGREAARAEEPAGLQQYVLLMALIFAVIAIGTTTLVLWTELEGAFVLPDPLAAPALSLAAGASVGSLAGLIYHDSLTARARLADEVERTRVLNQRLRVVNRLLRHNVRNTLDVALAKIDQVERAHDDPRLVDAATDCRDALQKLHSQTEKTLHIDRIDVGQADRVEIELADVLDRAVDDWTARARPVTFRRAFADRPVVLASPLTSVAIEEAIENAVRHNDNESLTVELAIETGPESVTLRVCDDGSGLAADEVSALDLDAERPLHHASGVGLWLVKWITEASGGRMRIEDGIDGGVCVAMTLPRA